MVVPLPDLRGDLVQIEGDLGDQDAMGAPGNARVEGDPARIAAHDLHHDDPLVALGGAVQAVEALGGKAHGRVEAEGGVGLVQVVVDGLGHAHHPEALLGQGVGDGEGAIPADGHQGVQLPAAEVLQDLIRAVHFPQGAVGHPDGEVQGVALVCGAKDGAAQVGDAPHPLPGELEHAPLGVALGEQDAVVALVDPVDLPAQVGGRDDRGPDDGVEARRVAAPCADGDATDGIGHSGPSFLGSCENTGTSAQDREIDPEHRRGEHGWRAADPRVLE